MASSAHDTVTKTDLTTSSPDNVECNVCYEKYDKKIHAKVVCEHGDCLYDVCKTCVRIYLCGTTSDASCMKCNKVWSDKFLVDNLNTSFVRKEYKVHRRELLLQQQISRLPESMAAVEALKEKRKIEEDINRLDKIITQNNKLILELKKKLAAVKHETFEFTYHPLDCLSLDLTKVQNETTCQGIIRSYIMATKQLTAFGDGDNKQLNKRRNEKKDLIKSLETEYKKIGRTEFPSLDLYYKKENEYTLSQNEIIKKLNDANTEKQILLDNRNALFHNIQIIGEGGAIPGAAGKKEAKKFIMPCPKTDCRGYLSTQYKCELCEFHTCCKCFELIGESKSDPHECKPENIESAEYIRKQSKPCPCCGTRISKIDGCDQMWCTQCHKAFSWNTGKLVTGTIHNPHFYQFQRENGGGVAPRNPGDVVCGGLCDYRLLERLFRGKNKNLYVESFTNKHRQINHIIHIILADIRVNLRENEDCLKERVKYIMNEITKDQLATQVMKKDIMRKKNLDILHIYELVIEVGIDMFRGMIESDNVGEHFEQEILDRGGEFNKLIDYCNDQFKKISITYGSTVPCLDMDLHVLSTKYNVNGNVSSQIMRRNETNKIQKEFKDTINNFRNKQMDVLRKMNEEFSIERDKKLHLIADKPTQEEKRIASNSLTKYQKEMAEIRDRISKEMNDEYDEELLKLKKYYETKYNVVLSTKNI